MDRQPEDALYVKYAQIALFALVLLLGFLWWNEREGRQRDAFDRTAQDLAEKSEGSTVALRDADTVYVRTDRHFTQVRTRVDTVPLSPEVRDVIRSCDELQVSCASRAAKSDTLIADLRRELEHAQNPPPGPRLSWRIRAGRDFTASQWEGAAGPRLRLLGPVEAYAEAGVRPFTDSLGSWRSEGRLVAGVELNFGGRR